MDRFLAAYSDASVPDVNPDIMNGFAMIQMRDLDEYISELVHSISRSFPAGIRFKQMRQCTPEEEYRERTKLKTNRRTHDISKLDFTYKSFDFEYNGVPIPPRYQQIPFLRDGTILHISGTKYHVTPVLSHKVLSPGDNSVFVQLIRDRFTFYRRNYSFVADGKVQNSQVIWSNIYRRGKKGNTSVAGTTKADTCIVHYLLGKYGYDGMFQKFLGYIPVVGTEDDITPEAYPDSDWIICQSTYRSIGGKPHGYIQSTYTATRIRFAVPRHKWGAEVEYMMTGLFYVLDHFSTEIIVPSMLNSTNLIKVLMGHIISSGQFAWDKLFTSISEHYSYIDNYADSIIVKKVAARGYIIEDFYDLLWIILKDFNGLIHDEKNSNLNMYEKVLETRYYLLDALARGLMDTIFALNKLATKRTLSIKDITDAFNKSWRPGMVISSITNNRDITSVVSCSTDHKYPKITSQISEQEGRSNNGKGANGTGRNFDISMAVIGNAFYMSKSNSSPTSRVNMFAIVDPISCETKENPLLAAIHASTNELLCKQREDTIDMTLLD